MSTPIRIKDWVKFQHFKDRRPPWIKLYRELLDDPHWHALDGAAAKHLVMLWLIASEDESKQGLLPDVSTLAFRLRITEKAVRHLINTLSRWLECDDIKSISDRYQVGPPETETETETQTQERGRGRKPGKILLPDAWAISDSHFELGNKLGLTKEEIEEAAHEMRDWSIGNREMRSYWDSVFNNWIRRNAKRKNNAYGRPRAFQDDSRSASKGAARLIEKAKRGEFAFGPRPGLSVEPSATVVQLLPQRRSE